MARPRTDAPSLIDAHSAALEALEVLATKFRAEYGPDSHNMKRLEEAGEVVRFALNAMLYGPLADPERRMAKMARLTQKPVSALSDTTKRIRIVTVASLVLKFRELGVPPDQLASHVRAMLEGPIAPQFGSIDSAKMSRILEKFAEQPKRRADGRKAGGATKLSSPQRLAAELVLALKVPGFGADRTAVIKAFGSRSLPNSPK